MTWSGLRAAGIIGVLIAAAVAVFIVAEDDLQRVDSIGGEQVLQDLESTVPVEADAVPLVANSIEAGASDDPATLNVADSDTTSTMPPTAADGSTTDDQTATSDPLTTSSLPATAAEGGSPVLEVDPDSGAAQEPGTTPGVTRPSVDSTAAPSEATTSPDSSAPATSETSRPTSPTTDATPTTSTDGAPTVQSTTIQPAPPPPAGDLAARLYPGWCRSGPPAAPAAPAGDVVSVAPGESIQRAIDDLASGVVELQPGIHTIGSPIRLRSNVVLRGASRSAVIRTSAAMDHMVIVAGGYTGSRAATLSSANAFATTITTGGGSLSPGLWLIGDASAGQVVRVLSASGNRATLELPLTRDFSGFAISPQQTPITRSGLERVALQPRHTVKDLVMVRSAFDSWIDNVETDGSGGQVRSSVYLRQAYRVGVYNSDFVTARELGDGGQGYGINVANNSSNVVIDGNRLRMFRHSILLHAGAAGNVIKNNRSEDARHPNFVEGGPGDISFHGYATANLVMGNSVERIQINDAGTPGPHNAIVGNTLRVGPLTLDNGVDNLTLLGNIMEGSVGALRARVMPSIVAESTAGSPSPARSYWSLGYDPFGRSGDSNFDRFGDGILDWGSGGDVYVDSSVRSINPCSL